MGIKYRIHDERFDEWEVRPFVQVEEHTDHGKATLDLFAEWWDPAEPSAPGLGAVDYISHPSNGRTVPIELVAAQALHLFTLLNGVGVYVFDSTDGER